MKLDASGPLEVDSILGVLETHAIPGAEIFDAGSGSLTRLVRTSAGPCVLSVSIEADGVEVDAQTLDGEPLGESGTGEVAGIVRDWLDLDAEVEAINRALSGDPVLSPLVAARPGLRVVGYPDGFEAAVMTVLGQQVSVVAGRTFGSRLVREYGSPVSDGLIVFPEPVRLAAVPVDELRAALGITNARARTVSAVAEAFAGGLDVGRSADREATRRDLLALPGIGPWTVECLAMRVLGDPDAFPSSDLVLRRALGGVSAKEAESMSESWRPWRAYALFHLWTAEYFLMT